MNKKGRKTLPLQYQQMDLHNRHTIRLSNWDYSSGGYYFVTVCTQNREHLFGEILDGKMKTNKNGKMVNKIWKSLSKRYPVNLDEFQIMPNHFHGIIIQHTHMGSENPTPTKTTTLGQTIAYFKYQTTKLINNKSVGAGLFPPHQYPKIWQRNYYEHIIRNEKELIKIQKYIINNPEKWDLDENNL